jgi:hypothetical protein
MSSLPSIPEPSIAWMLRFEALHGHRTSVPAIFSALGFARGLRALFGVLRRQVFGPDPLKTLGPDNRADLEDWLARRQLRPLLWLDDTLSRDLKLSDAERHAALGAVVSATGAAFLGQLFPAIQPEAWQAASNNERETLVRRTMRRFGNIAQADVMPSETGVGFDVRRCRFHRMVNALGRPDLGPLFCEADFVYFNRDNTMYSFQRSTTRANGGDVCDFRLTWKGGAEDA